MAGKIVVFKLALDDGVVEIARVDENWNWTGNPEYLNALKLSVLKTGSREFSTRLEDLPRLFNGKAFWAEVKNESNDL